ncbi:uncharacterized protein LOC101848040 [Aplysia californica]|uniref:Uncharacterized protein LOC101848040 n=1 Tax=Aplysia californica TaxID=6500 RepID=A0ABM0JLR5_APLCA|nr:uncharacterized protein LOC101848040 [Aplysia californica]
MYTLFDGKSTWPASSLQPVYYSGPVPTTPTYMLGTTPSLGDPSPQPVLYSLQTPLFPSAIASSPTDSRHRLTSDDVFLPETPAVIHDSSVFSYALQHQNYQNAFTSAANLTNASGHPVNFESKPENSSLDVEVDTSSDCSRSSNFGLNSPPRKFEHTANMSCQSSTVSSSPSSICHDDSRLLTNSPPHYNILDANDSVFAPPFQSLSSSHPQYCNNSDSNYYSQILDIKCGFNRGRMITSASSERCPRFSQNGITEELDECDKSFFRAPEVGIDNQAKKREEFLLTLEAEREKQRKLVLPKYTPKMNCKFCKNNGESPEVYTKHRLHYNEKTICPLLRHYVCRLCNSTGDFAHTIRHCPFNSKKDKIAWKATFLV